MPCDVLRNQDKTRETYGHLIVEAEVYPKTGTDRQEGSIRDLIGWERVRLFLVTDETAKNLRDGDIGWDAFDMGCL